MTRIIFEDPVFDAQLLRTMSHVYYGGADIGKCLATARRIRNGDVPNRRGSIVPILKSGSATIFALCIAVSSLLRLRVKVV